MVWDVGIGTEFAGPTHRSDLFMTTGFSFGFWLCAKLRRDRAWKTLVRHGRGAWPCGGRQGRAPGHDALVLQSSLTYLLHAAEAGDW